MPVNIYRPETAIMGSVQIGAFCGIAGSVEECVRSIGRYSTIAWGVRWPGFCHPIDRITTSSMTYHAGYFGDGPEPAGIPAQNGVTIENDVFVGEYAYIKEGVTLHTGCVVAPCSVVTRDVPPYAIVGGNPARIIRYRFDDKLIERLLRSEWWRYDLRRMPFPLRDVCECLDEIESGRLAPYRGQTLNGADLAAIASIRHPEKLETRPAAVGGSDADLRRAQLQQADIGQHHCA